MFGVNLSPRVAVFRDALKDAFVTLCRTVFVKSGRFALPDKLCYTFVRAAVRRVCGIERLYQLGLAAGRAAPNVRTWNGAAKIALYKPH